MKVPFLSSILAVSMLIALNAQAQSLDSRKIQQIASSSLQYIASEQVPETNPVYWKGEWPTHIVSTLVPAAVGVGQLIGHNEEATAFTTGMVVNALAALYNENPEMDSTPEFQKIPHLIAAAVPTFERYREGDLFNFYPPRDWNGVRVHQPVDMSLIFAWKGFTNIPQDADTTSVVYTALLNNSLLQSEKYHVPESALASLQNFRDLDRKSHFYNKREGRMNTGAFMTWQFDEKSPFMPRFWFASPDKGTRIPFNRNDVDCIVNLNVLRMLALNRTPQVEGRSQACSMINDMIRNDEHASCGIYYPNTFNLAYSAAQTEKAGETCIEADRKKQAVEFILKLQSADGGWDNDRNVWNDRVQSTAFAMTALLQFADPHDFRIQSSLQYGARFLLSQMKKSRQSHRYWKGETFFTATAIARSLVIWKSNSYTTAIVANVLLKVAKLYP